MLLSPLSPASLPTLFRAHTSALTHVPNPLFLTLLPIISLTYLHPFLLTLLPRLYLANLFLPLLLHVPLLLLALSIFLSVSIIFYYCCLCHSFIEVVKSTDCTPFWDTPRNQKSLYCCYCMQINWHFSVNSFSSLLSKEIKSSPRSYISICASSITGGATCEYWSVGGVICIWKGKFPALLVVSIAT